MVKNPKSSNIDFVRRAAETIDQGGELSPFEEGAFRDTKFRDNVKREVSTERGQKMMDQLERQFKRNSSSASGIIHDEDKMDKKPNEKENSSQNRSEERIVSDVGKGTDTVYVTKSNPEDVKLDINNIRHTQNIGEPNINSKQTYSGEMNAKINLKAEAHGRVIPNPDRLTYSTINDIPTSHDTIGFAPIVKALARILIHPETQTPLTVGIYGPWGSGKTSFMKQVKAEIAQNSNKEDILQIDFNAWKYSNKEELWVALLCSIANTFEHQCGSIKKYFYRLKLMMKNVNKPSLIWNIVLLTIIILLALIIPLPFGSKVEASKWYGLLNSISFLPKSAIGLASFFIISKSARTNIKKFLLPIGLDFNEVVSSSSTKSIGSFDDFQSKFKAALDLYIPKSGRLIVYIDDLDRCSPPNTVKVIEAISLFLDLEKCIFLLGTDYYLFSKSIEVYYQDIFQKFDEEKSNQKNGLLIETEKEKIFINYEKPYGQYFLDKIIQIPIFIPKLNKTERRQYLNSMLRTKNTESEANVPTNKTESSSKAKVPADKELSLENEMIESLINVASIINPNPRNLKRFLTKFRFLYFLYYLNYRIFPRIEDDLLLIWFLYHELCADEISDLNKYHKTMPWNDFLTGFLGAYKKINALSQELGDRDETKNLLQLQKNDLTIEAYLELTRCLRIQ